jgi:hypothetical protein
MVGIHGTYSTQTVARLAKRCRGDDLCYKLGPKVGGRVIQEQIRIDLMNLFQLLWIFGHLVEREVNFQIVHYFVRNNLSPLGATKS